jgi:hypothetical protein
MRASYPPGALALKNRFPRRSPPAAGASVCLWSTGVSSHRMQARWMENYLRFVAAAMRRLMFHCWAIDNRLFTT